jgi:uncharacterized hydrophobic protein (TIGR00271 family)
VYDPQALGTTLGTIERQVTFDPAFIVFMASSGTLVAIGLLTNSIPILIGAMIVAPLFPALGLTSLGLVVGDKKLAGRSAGIVLAGLLIAVGFTILTTWALNALDILAQTDNLVNRPLIEERVRPGYYSMLVAIAAGLAGMYALLQQKTDTIIGTVASVALVPAAGAAGISLVSGDMLRALGGAALLAINVGLIIAMGVLLLILLGRGRRAPR